MPTSPWIVQVDATNFQQVVVEQSLETPVVVEFHAEWADSSRTLSPELERLTEERAGAVILARVDVDKNPEFVQAFQVQGVPTVIAIHKGQPVDAFSGVMAPAELAAFFDRLAPAAPVDELEQVAALEEQGDLEGAAALLKQHLAQRPADWAARIRLARLLIDGGDAPGAREVIDALDPERAESDEAVAVLARIALAEGAGDLGELEQQLAANPENHSTRIELGKSLVAGGRAEEGLEHLLEVVRRDRTYGDDAGRKAMLEIFEALGAEHPATLEYMQLLQMELFV